MILGMGDIHFISLPYFFSPNFFIFILRRKNTGKKENFVKYRKNMEFRQNTELLHPCDQYNHTLNLSVHNTKVCQV